MRTNFKALLENLVHRSSRREEAQIVKGSAIHQSLVTSAATIAFSAGLLLSSAGSALAAVRFVDVNTTNPMPPYTSWATAATGIQDAVDAAGAGDEVVVTNGIYSVGGRSTVGQSTTTNRVVVDKPLALRSVNGPQFTIIDGRGVFRCVYLTNGASLSGFTLTNGAASQGGGLWCESTNAIAFNCVVSGNSSTGGGTYRGTGAYCCGSYRTEQTAFAGGVYGGTVNNCILNGNWAANYATPSRACDLSTCRIVGIFCPSSPCGDQFPGQGGGAVNAILNNCTLTGNGADFGGGAYSCTLNNCTLAGNTAFAYDGDGGSVGSGGGVSDSILNNCIVYSNTAPQDANYDSSSTLNYSCTTPLPTNGVGNITNAPLFVNRAAGNYRLRPDSPCIDAGTNLSASITNDLDGRPRPLDGNGDGLAAFDMGAYEYLTPLLVWQDSPIPTPPHADWATAAHTIQDAVDAAVAGDEIVVTNGIYATGARAAVGDSTMNRIVVDKPLTLRSLNGPAFTAIRGDHDGSGVRCVYLANGASLSGFTLTNGISRGIFGKPGNPGHGGGVWCESTNAVVSNCVVVRNWAEGKGGGAFGGTLNQCILISNLASTFQDIVGEFAGLGGGAFECVLNNCTLTGNKASNPAGAGGGAYGGTLNNCTLTGNIGVGASGCTLNNCIVYFNQGANYSYSTLSYSCTTPLPTNGVANITNPPLFVNETSGNLRLQSNSPCINAGSNAFAPAGPDLDGNSRIVRGTVDIGAYEFQTPASAISYAWLQQFNLPIDGSADTADLDGDRMNNWQEWRCATDPTSALSALRLLTPVTAGMNVAVTWQSVAGMTYFLERGVNLAASPVFTSLATNLTGQTNTTTYTDTNGAGAFFYRVGVNAP